MITPNQSVTLLREKYHADACGPHYQYDFDVSGCAEEVHIIIPAHIADDHGKLKSRQLAFTGAIDYMKLLIEVTQ